MRRSFYRSGVTAVLTAIVIITTTTLSHADDPIPTWIYARCATGHLASAQNDGQGDAVVLGSAAFCGLQVLNSSFGVAVYQTGDTAVNVMSYNLRRYPVEVGVERSFGMYVSGKPGTFGVCLVASPSYKIACGKIVFKNSGAVTFQTISPTDSLVSAKIDGEQIAADPRCGYCW